jgi:hypothetical protein
MVSGGVVMAIDRPILIADAVGAAAESGGR